ncbi:MAG: DUF5829 family protein [Gemmatimonadales bacterium]
MKRSPVLLCFACLAFTPLQAQERPAATFPPVFLDHVYLVLDGQTYRDIVDSEFMRNQFSRFRERTIVLDTQSHTAAYITGEQTYIEIFEADKDPRFTLGMVGIAFNVEEAGGSELLLHRLNAQLDGNAKIDLSTVRQEEKDVPIFYATYVEYADTLQTVTLSTWVMEYYQEAFKSDFPDMKPEDGVTRKQALANTFESGRYLRDVYEVTVALDDTQARRLINELEVFGYTISEDGERKTGKGPDITIVITPLTTATGGITELKMSLLREKEGQQIYNFGAKSVLTFTGDSAIWVF